MKAQAPTTINSLLPIASPACHEAIAQLHFILHRVGFKQRPLDRATNIAFWEMRGGAK